MRFDKSLLIGAVLAIALLTAASTASGSAPKLLFTSHGAPYEGPVNMALDLTTAESAEPSCTAGYFESQFTNDRPKDQVTPDVFRSAVCFGPEYTLSESVKKVTFIWNGHVIVHGKLTLAGPGPCVYNFSNLIASIEVPGLSLTPNSPVKGALIRRESNLFCAPLKTLNLEINFQDSSHEALVSELRG
jgi:hypothetical protein